jgi:hypothetical protein
MFGQEAEAAHSVRIIETRLLRTCCLLTACSPEDLWYFKEISEAQDFSISSSSLLANGIEQPATHDHNAALILPDVPEPLAETKPLIALFMGSAHGPNTDAVKAIVRAAKDPALDSRWRFVVLGSVGWPWVGDEKRPLQSEGIFFESVVSEAEKLNWLARADVGLNPVVTGSGTNLKFAEYAVMGLPILSTAFGARGGLWSPNVHFMPISAEQQRDVSQSMVFALNAFASNLACPTGRAQIRRMAQSARSVAQTRLDWRPISDQFAQSLELAIGQPLKSR